MIDLFSFNQRSYLAARVVLYLFPATPIDEFGLLMLFVVRLRRRRDLRAIMPHAGSHGRSPKDGAGKIGEYPSVT